MVSAARPPMPRSARLLAVLLCLLAARPAPAATPPPEPAPEPTFFEVVDVRVVNVDVVVTDRQGRPVPGLTREDFELLEDGRPIEIAYFYAEAEAPAPAETIAVEAPPPAAAAAPAVAKPAPEPAAPDEQRLHLAVLFDDQSLLPPQRNRLLPALRRFLDSELHAGDRLLVARYNGSLWVQEPQVGDAGALEAALKRVAKTAGRGGEQRAELAALLRGIQDAGLPGEQLNDPAEMQAHALHAQVRAYAQARYDEVRRTLEAVSNVVEALAGLPGRKALLYIGGGFPLHPAEAVYRAWETKYGRLAARLGASPLDARQLDATPLLRDVAARANAGRVTLYALGAPEDNSALGLEVGTMSLKELGSASGGITWSAELAATESFNLAQPLQMMAGPTGGVAAYDTPDPTGFLATLRQDVSSYYSLGFVPERRDGKPRRLAVRVKREGLKVRHREAYREASGRERASRSTRSAVLLGWTENPLEAAIELLKTDRDRDGHLLLDLLVKVPMAKLVLLPQSEFHEGKLTVFIGARDDEGRSSDLQEIALPIRVPNDQLLTALGQTVAYHARLRLRPLSHLLAVGVRDELGNVESTVTTRFTPPAAGAGAVGPGS